MRLLHCELLLGAAVAALLAGCETNRRGTAPPPDGPTRDAIESETDILQSGFSPDSRHFAYLDQAGTIHLWDVLLDQRVGQIPLRAIEPRVVVMGTGLRFAVAGSQGVEVRRADGFVEAKLPTTPSPVSFLLFDEGSKNLTVAEESGTVRVVHIASGEVRRQFDRPTDEPGWSLTPGAGFGVMYVHRDGRVRVVPCDPEATGRKIDAVTSPGTGQVVSEDSRTLALISSSGAVEVWSLTSARLRTTLAPEYGIVGLDLSPDGSVLAVAASTAMVELWDIDGKRRLDSFPSLASAESPLRFSPDGSFVSWVEANRASVRFWVPARGAMQWTADGPVLREDARGVCDSYASILRFRLAAQPFEDGKARLESRDDAGALAALEQAAHIFPTYPGLQDALAEANARHDAELLPAQLEELRATGEHVAALRLLDAYLAAYARFDEFGFTERAATLRAMLEHLDAAEQHRKAARDVDAVLEFERAVVLEPDLLRQHPQYADLRDRVERTLAEEATAAHAAGQFERVVERYTDLARLRALSSASLLKLGQAHEALGYPEQAEAAWSEVARDATEYETARRSIARTARAAGDHRKALDQLELAREVATGHAALEREYAEACRLCGELDRAVAAWHGVAQLEREDPRPFEIIAKIEQQRERWSEAAAALREAAHRSEASRPQLLVDVADLFRKAGQSDQVLATYLELLELGERQPNALAFVGPTPRRTIDNWIRRLGYVHHRDEWLPRDQVMLEQGWVRSGAGWLRPEEAKLREVASRYQAVSDAELRVLGDDRYADYVAQRRIGKGMNRREVIGAWGFFEDLNSYQVEADGVVYEQLLFENSRRVYLKNGLVCFWTE